VCFCYYKELDQSSKEKGKGEIVKEIQIPLLPHVKRVAPPPQPGKRARKSTHDDRSQTYFQICWESGDYNFHPLTNRKWWPYRVVDGLTITCSYFEVFESPDTFPSTSCCMRYRWWELHIAYVLRPLGPWPPKRSRSPCEVLPKYWPEMHYDMPAANARHLESADMQTPR